MNKLEKNTEIRSKKYDVKRIAVYLCVLVITAVVNFTLGKDVSEKNYENIQKISNWGFRNYQLPARFQQVPEYIKDRKLIVYISNSHAKTGGGVTSHLTNFLEAVVPGEFEVVDLSEPGIFAPDILQRALYSLQYKPDLIIFGVSYISFSDRMRLQQQAHSVRSFFKSAVRSELPLSFWFRHYDIGLYANTLFNQYVDLHKHRNEIRNQWELPISSFLKKYTGDKYIYFLEADENTSWKFPEGYDRNLFQWRLYSAGRNKHLEDMKNAIEIASKKNVAVFGVNLPIHFEKSRFNADYSDYEIYRKELGQLFKNTEHYVDYQDIFPKEFTTYDALHPTMHGARLHALHYAELIINKFKKYNNQIEKLWLAFKEVSEKEEQEYIDHLSINAEKTVVNSFSRYDLSDLKSANTLLSKLSNVSVGSNKELEYLIKLQLRIRFWAESDFSMVDKTQSMSSDFIGAYKNEVSRAALRINIFKEKLINIQTARLNKYPLPVLSSDLSFVRENVVGGIKASIYKSHSGDLYAKYSTLNGKIIALSKRDGKTNAQYTRVDLLGDGSFILLAPNNKVVVPSWVTSRKPFVKFGV